MLGKKIYKPLQDDTIVVYEEREFTNAKGEKVKIQVPVEKPNDAPNTLSKYAECAKWCNENDATIEDKGDYYECVEIKPVEYTDDQLAEQARQKRDALIAETDYLVMPDYPISAENLEAIKAYRQKLRDVPQQETFPSEVTWPEKPVIQKL